MRRDINVGHANLVIALRQTSDRVPYAQPDIAGVDIDAIYGQLRLEFRLPLRSAAIHIQQIHRRPQDVTSQRLTALDLR
jgi:hypothetical protein